MHVAWLSKFSLAVLDNDCNGLRAIFRFWLWPEAMPFPSDSQVVQDLKLYVHPLTGIRSVPYGTTYIWWFISLDALLLVAERSLFVRQHCTFSLASKERIAIVCTTNDGRGKYSSARVSMRARQKEPYTLHLVFFTQPCMLLHLLALAV